MEVSSVLPVLNRGLGVSDSIELAALASANGEEQYVFLSTELAFNLCTWIFSGDFFGDFVFSLLNMLSPVESTGLLVVFLTSSVGAQTLNSFRGWFNSGSLRFENRDSIFLGFVLCC